MIAKREEEDEENVIIVVSPKLASPVNELKGGKQES